MWYIIIAFLAIVILYTFFARGFMILMNKMSAQSMLQMMKDTEHIVKEHTVPDRWIKKNSPIRKGHNHQDQAHQKRRVIMRLEKLIHSYQKSNLVKDEETRSLLLDQLQTVLEEWREKKWNKMVEKEQDNPQPDD